MEDRIKSVMSAVFEISEDEIDEKTSPDTVQSWDSLKHMELVIALEEEFGIELTDKDLAEMLNYALIELIIDGKGE